MLKYQIALERLAHSAPEGLQDVRSKSGIDVDTVKQLGDADHVKVSASVDAAETWFQENDPEGVAFEYDVLE